MVQHHMKFLRDHACNPSASNVTACPEAWPLINSSLNSKTREISNKPLDAVKILTDSSVTTASSGLSSLVFISKISRLISLLLIFNYFSGPGHSLLVRTPRCQSPRISKPVWNLAPLSEERSSGRDRSPSEQTENPISEMQNLEVFINLFQ